MRKVELRAVDDALDRAEKLLASSPSEDRTQWRDREERAALKDILLPGGEHWERKATSADLAVNLSSTTGTSSTGLSSVTSPHRSSSSGRRRNSVREMPEKRKASSTDLSVNLTTASGHSAIPPPKSSLPSSSSSSSSRPRSSSTAVVPTPLSPPARSSGSRSARRQSARFVDDAVADEGRRHAMDVLAPLSLPPTPAVVLEPEFAVLSRHMLARGLRIESLSRESRMQLLNHYLHMQRCTGEEFAQLIHGCRGTPWGQTEHIGYLAGMLDRKSEWKSAFLAADGVNVLYCYLLRVQDFTFGESMAAKTHWYVVNDAIRCIEQVVTTFGDGAEGVVAHEKCLSLVVEALEMQDDGGQCETVALLSTIAQQSVNSLCAIISVFVRNRRALEDFLAMMGSRSASVDLRVKSLVLLNHLLSQQSGVWHSKLVVHLMRCNLSLELDLMLELVPNDENLGMLVQMLRERNPDFRRKDPQLLFSQLSEGIKGNKVMSASFANVLDHLSKLDQTEAVWKCVDGFMATLSMTPVVGGDTKGWFVGVVSRYAATPDARVEALQAKVAQLQLQLEVHQRNNNNNKTNGSPTRVVGGEEAEGSSDDEFVDLNRDGCKTDIVPKNGIYKLERHKEKRKSPGSRSAGGGAIK